MDNKIRNEDRYYDKLDDFERRIEKNTETLPFIVFCVNFWLFPCLRKNNGNISKITRIFGISRLQ